MGYEKNLLSRNLGALEEQLQSCCHFRDDHEASRLPEYLDRRIRRNNPNVKAQQSLTGSVTISCLHRQLGLIQHRQALEYFQNFLRRGNVLISFWKQNKIIIITKNIIGQEQVNARTGRDKLRGSSSGTENWKKQECKSSVASFGGGAASRGPSSLLAGPAGPCHTLGCVTRTMWCHLPTHLALLMKWYASFQ